MKPPNKEENGKDRCDGCVHVCMIHFPSWGERMYTCDPFSRPFFFLVVISTIEEEERERHGEEDPFSVHFPHYFFIRKV
jgi:hypothetical protein